jgi:hypothetical protein
MDKIKNYENFEIDNPKDESVDNMRQYHFIAKIVIILAVIIVFQIIYLLVIYSSIKEINSNISNINLKKYILDDGNKKLDRTLHECFKKDFEYDEETKKKDNEIKTKENLIKDYKQKGKKLIKNLNNSQPIEEILSINEGKKNIINGLKKTLDKNISNFRKHFKSKIVDSWGELDSIKNLTKIVNKFFETSEPYLKLVYSYEYNSYNNELNYEEANFAIDFNENITLYVMIFSTNILGRYGIALTQNNDDNYLIFDLNNKKNNLLENNWIKFKFDRQNLKLLLNNIKDYNFEKKNKEIDYIKCANITELEIYKVF